MLFFASGGSRNAAPLLRFLNAAPLREQGVPGSNPGAPTTFSAIRTLAPFRGSGRPNPQ
jgi:hypothetical protein